MSFSEFIMEDVKPEGWRQLLQPRGAAGKNSTSLLRRSSSWRRPGERGYYEGPAAQVNEPPRRARPLSCIEGGRMDKWLQTLERLQSRQLQNQIPPFADRAVSMPFLQNEMAESNLLCPDVSSFRRKDQTPSVCPSVCESFSSSLESVHIKAAPAAERAEFCALAPVRFGWLPIQRRVILTDISDKSHDKSRCQADVFVAPMIQTNMTSTLIGSSLLNKGGQQLQNNFNNAKGRHTLKPGDVLEVDATRALGCSKVFFIECAPKGNKHISEKALSSGLGRVFELCEQNSLGSVALPVLGPGIVLSIPVKDAVNILTTEICKFLSGPTGQLHTICIPIMPNYPTSEEMFQTVCGNLSAKMVNNTGQALFQSLTSDLDEIIMIVDGIEVHLVFGDITNETTDAVVNTTDFKDFQTAAQVASGQIFTTPPGGFPCRTIMHVCGQRDPGVIKTLAKKIVVQCEQGRYRSVAIPAICAGQGGLDPSVVAKSILEGLKEGIQGANLQHLKNIRIILLKINVFLEFKATALQIFGVSSLLTAKPKFFFLPNSKSREKDEDLLFAKVTWCVLGLHGVWQKVPKDLNYKLEKKDVKDGFVDAQGVKWTVDLQKMEATSCDSGQVTALKRLENLSDFALPIYWDNMSQSDSLKVIDLDQSSAEYKTVKADFKKTVKKTVLKIQRIQNINLRRLYEVRKKELENKNGSVGAAEKILYHGTSEASCSAIMKTNFNRSLAGQNATLYGHGTYFAVHASYSANPTYAVPAADGTQCMFVARVLTGDHALGQMDIKTPPVRVAPDHLYDSVVDNMQNPSMFVVFHDCQAYPDYLITFK
ncbi:poly [ADP-ribose] polymerase 14-like protein [Labeo rohita]|uniref:Poly [ADP-ribose] polymerase n=1 Tax=Labeo rohita TaxID=84645 RepID=A0A498MPT5_LABRO|nr:poly [ADP-ribose] polymerase 14-like protein [Labeo rohita]